MTFSRSHSYLLFGRAETPEHSDFIASVLSSIPCIIVTIDLQVKKLASKGR